MGTMTAKQLIDWAAECVTCGKIHKPVRLATGNGATWAGKDGHAYRTRLYDLTGHSSGGVLAALRQIAGLS